MPTRNVSFMGRSGTWCDSLASLIPCSMWRNYSLAIWTTKEPLMLRLELYESWSDENFVRFKRVPYEGRLSELTKRKVGTTNWPDESIVTQAIKIVGRGPPYVTQRWHVLWPDHQAFVEELSDTIIKNPKPPVTPPRLLVYHNSDAVKNWNRKGPPMAVTSEEGEDTVSDDWSGGKRMLRAYPGGPGRIRKGS